MLDRGWRTIVVVASGPSLDAEQAARITAARDAGRCRIIAINDAWAYLPTADILYACDLSWFRAKINEWVANLLGISDETVTIDAIRSLFKGEVWTQSEEAAREYLLCHVKGEKGAGIHPRPDTIYHGGNSGYQASVGLAPLFGAKEIILSAFDMQRTDGRAHFFGDHRKPLSQGNPTGWIKHFETVAPLLKQRGIRVINASRVTALLCFERMRLEDALAMEAA